MSQASFIARMRIALTSIYSPETGIGMKQILVAVDEHPHAEQIVDSAIQLADAISAKILLIYVVERSSVPERYRDTHGDALPEHYYDDQYRRTVGPLLKKIEKAGIKYEGISASGDPEKEILKTAKSKDVSYIVIGTRALSGLGRLRAIGSVSRNVIEKSTVPVVAVP
jgi:nucleotide-binding universal stress UspA family protein